MNKMLRSCPFLKKELVPLCRVSEKPYIPSTHQLKEFCSRTYHRRCPLLRERKTDLSDKWVMPGRKLA